MSTLQSLASLGELLLKTAANHRYPERYCGVRNIRNVAGLIPPRFLACLTLIRMLMSLFKIMAGMILSQIITRQVQWSA